MHIFKDRKEAGQVLAKSLLEYQSDPNVIVLALPRGGVPVSYEIATRLHLPWTVFLVRKLGVPGHSELAMGAIAEEDIRVLNYPLIESLNISDEQIEHVVAHEKQELERRFQQYRQGTPLPALKNKTVILVDDGIATGATVQAAIQALEILAPKKIIVAVPVASKESLSEITPLIAKMVCPLVPEPFYGVGQWYHYFPQISDEEVLALLSKWNLR